MYSGKKLVNMSGVKVVTIWKIDPQAEGKLK